MGKVKKRSRNAAAGSAKRVSGGSAKIAQAVICNKQMCVPRDLLVRGDHISFVSVEQAERTGIHPLDDQKMPSDIVMPKDFCLIEDPTGKYLRKCDFYILRWQDGDVLKHGVSDKVEKVAADYFGNGTRLKPRTVDIPAANSWRKSAQIAFIRYRRAGELSGNYEHPYNPSVWIYETNKPIGWRIALPTGCVVDGRGFVWP